MTIVFFASYFEPYLSGITTYPKKLLSHLAKKNRVIVLTFKHSSELASNEKIFGVEVVRMPFELRVSKGFISFQSLRYFWHYAGLADAVLLNFPNAEGFFLAIFVRLFGKKLFGIFHCRVFLQNSLFGRIAAAVINLSVWLQMALTNKIVIYTRDYFQSLSWEKLFTKKTSQCYPPISNLEIQTSFSKQLQKLKGDKKWVGFAGRVASEKGLEYLIEAISLLKNKNVELVIAGPALNQVVGEETYYYKITELLKEKGLKTHFLGILTEGKLGAFYKNIDVLALTSINQTEAFGMVQVEAMMLGTPVIASNLPGVREPVKVAKMGRLAEIKNIESIKQGLQDVLLNKTAFVSKQKIEKIQQLFEEKKAYQFYEDLLDEK